MSAEPFDYESALWGAERLLWQIPGVYVTAAGYSGGFTRNPTYQETTTGLTGHTEVVLVVYDPVTVSFADITPLRPGTMTVTDGTSGAPIDPLKLSNYSLSTVTAQRSP